MLWLLTMPLCKFAIMGDAMKTIPAGLNPASAQSSATAQNPASTPNPSTTQHGGARSVPACDKPVLPQTHLQCRSEGAKFRPAKPKKGFGIPKSISSEDAHLPIADGALPCDANGEGAHQPIEDGIGGHCAADGESEDVEDVDDVSAGIARAGLDGGLSQGAVTCESSSAEGSVSPFSERSRSPRHILPVCAGPAPNGPNDGDRTASRPPRPNQTIPCSGAANPIPGVPPFIEETKPLSKALLVEAGLLTKEQRHPG